MNNFISSVLRTIALSSCFSLKNARRQSGVHVVPAYIFIASRNHWSVLGRHFRGTVRRSTPIILDRAIYIRKWREEREREWEIEKDKKRSERSWRANLVRRRRYSSSRKVTVQMTKLTSTIHLAVAVSFVGRETSGNYHESFDSCKDV